MNTEQKRDWLIRNGFRVGLRDQRLNTNFVGMYMVVEEYEESELPTRDGRNGPWCIVGNDLDNLINRAFDDWGEEECYQSRD